MQKELLSRQLFLHGLFFVVSVLEGDDISECLLAVPVELLIDGVQLIVDCLVLCNRCVRLLRLDPRCDICNILDLAIGLEAEHGRAEGSALADVGQGQFLAENIAEDLDL